MYIIIFMVPRSGVGGEDFFAYCAPESGLLANDSSP